MKIKFKPRFYLICGIIILMGGLYASNLLIKKRVEIKLVDSGKDKVLAVSSSTYSLVEPQINADKGTQIDADPSSSAGDVPVTLSHTVTEGDSLASIATHYNADAQTIVDYPYNKIGDDLKIKVGQVLIIPNGYIEGQPKPILAQIPVGTGQFVYPAQGSISQYASWFHPGSIDIALDLRTSIVAADNGRVTAVEHYTTGYGNHVIIDHGGGLTSLYGHLSETRVNIGDVVSKGQLIGLSGSSGRSTGPHLHFEVRRAGKPIDPMTLLPGQ